MADLFDILNVNPAQSVQPQSLMQTIAGRMDRNIQQAAGNDVRDSQAKMQAASEGVDLNSSKGLLEFSQRLQNLGMTQQAMGVVQLAQQKRALETQEIKQAEQDAQRTAVSSFITNKWPELANVAPSMTIPQAQAYDAAKKAGELTPLQSRMIDYYSDQNETDLAAAVAGGSDLLSIAREGNDRLGVVMPTTNQLEAATAIIEAQDIGVKDGFWFLKKKPSDAEKTMMAMQIWSISQDSNVSLVEASEILKQRLAATKKDGEVTEITTLGKPNLTDVVVD